MINKLPFEILSKIMDWLFSPRFTSPSPAEEALITTLREGLVALDLGASPNNMVDDEWTGNLVELKQRLLQEDPRQFLRFDVLRKTMVVGNAHYVAEELGYLRRRNWRFWRDLLREVPIGNPQPFPLYPHTSGTLVHHAYHLEMFREHMGQSLLDLNLIVELGGGYGGLCRLFRSMGYAGDYLLYDLPYFSLLQKYYLQSLNINVLVNSKAELTTTSEGMVNCMYDINQVRKSVEGRRQGKNLFIGTWSISESPQNLRDEFFEIVDDFDLYLIAYQNKFTNNDNSAYFSDFCARKSTYLWKTIPIMHLPGNYYLFGKKELEKGNQMIFSD